jgi:predicted permease
MSASTDPQRRLRLRNSYLAVAVTIGAVVLLVCGWLSLALIGSDLDESFYLDNPGALLKLMWMLAAMMFGLIIGMGLGGWLWVIGARLAAGLTREEAEGLFFHNQPIIPGIEQYNRWCMNRVFPRPAEPHE